MRKAGKVLKAWSWHGWATICEANCGKLYDTEADAIADCFKDERVIEVEFRELPKPKRKRAPKREGER